MKPNGYLLTKPVYFEAVITEVARGFDVAPEDIMGRSYVRRIRRARMCAMAVLRDHTDLSYPAIGDLFDRDHTTVMSAVRRAHDDAELCRAIKLVAAEVWPL